MVRRFEPKCVLASLALIVGCGPPAVDPSIGQTAIGQWTVVSVDGVPIPPGCSIEIDYQEDGSMSIVSKGDGAPPIDAKGLEGALDHLNLPGLTMATLDVAYPGQDLVMKRKPGTIKGDR